MNHRKIIENALIPALLESYLLPFPDQSSVSTALSIVRDRMKVYLGFEIDLRKRRKLANRLNTIANKIIRYSTKNKFDSRKAIIATSAWANSLVDSGVIDIEKDSTRFTELLVDINELIDQGYDTIDNFEKIDSSAVKHIAKMHKIAQENGYFLDVDIKGVM